MLFFFTFLTVYDETFGDDPALYKFSYRCVNDPITSFTYDLPKFTEEGQWQTKGYSHTDDTITIPAGASGIDWLFWQIVSIPEINYTHIRLNCKTPNQANEDGTCFLQSSNPHKLKDMIYGLNPTLGSYKHAECSNPKLEDVTIKLSLQNHGNTDLVFNLPEVTYYIEKYKEFTDVSTSKVPNHPKVQRITAHIKGTDKIKLKTMALTNPHDFPKKYKYWLNLDYSDIDNKMSQVPIIANGTHILAVDILDDNFWHAWRLEKLWYNQTFETSFKMSIQARKEEGFDISYLLIETPTTSWLDALEKFHNEFAEIYHVQPLGIGASVPFYDMYKCFNGTTDDRDIYLGNFQWTTWPDQTKPYLPSFYFLEPTLFYVNMPFKQDTYEQDLLNCETEHADDPDLVHQCKVALESTSYTRENKMNMYHETSFSRDVYGCLLIFDQSNTYTHQHFLSDLDRLLHQGSRPPATGIHYDYYSYNSVSFVSRVDVVPNVLPYYLLEDGKDDYTPTVPLTADHFNHFKLFRDNASKGFSINSAWVQPQWVQFLAEVGYETEYVSGDTISFSDYQIMKDGIIRYQLGSRALSNIEMTSLSKLKDHFDELFAMHFASGSVPDFTNLWISVGIWDNCELLSEVREDYERWSPMIKAVLNNTMYQANNRGKVNLSFPAEGQNPEIDFENNFQDNEPSDLMTWCSKDSDETKIKDCYVSLFMAYNMAHSVGDQFKRTYNLTFEIDERDELQCFFTAKDTDCRIEGNSAIVSMSGIPSKRTFRTVVIYVKPASWLHGGVIAAFVLASFIVVAVIAFVIFLFCIKPRQDKKDISQSSFQMEK